MRVNEFDDVIYAAFLEYKFSVGVSTISNDTLTYYKRKGYHVYKDGAMYMISWLKPELLKHNDSYEMHMYDYFSAEHLYLTLTNNNNIQAHTPNVVKQKLLKSIMVKELFSVPNKTIVSLYSSIIDAVLLSGKKVYLTNGVLSLKPISGSTGELIYPVINMILDDTFDLSGDFVNTNVQPFEDIDYSLTYDTAKGAIT